MGSGMSDARQDLQLEIGTHCKLAAELLESVSEDATDPVWFKIEIDPSVNRGAYVNALREIGIAIVRYDGNLSS
jgi:hypothetical protein